MSKLQTTLMIAACAVLTLNCGTSDKSKQLKDANGKVIGRYDVLSDTDAKALFDVNQNGVHERVASYKENKVQTVEYFNDTNGNKMKTVTFKDGKPEAVKVFDKDGKEVRGNVLYDVDKNAAQEVTLPSKNKRVIFNPNGTISIAPVDAK